METLIAYGLAVIGFVMMAALVVPAITNNMPYPATRLMITNLLRTNPRQAELACKTGEGSFLDGIGAALKAGAMVGTRDISMIQKATVPTYDAMGSAAVQKWKGYLMKAKLGAMASGGSVVLAMQKDGIPWLLILLALAVGGGYGYLFLRGNELERSVVLARREVLPEVERALADGRY